MIQNKNTTQKKKRLYRSKRYRIILWTALASLMIGSTSTFAWYRRTERQADSAAAEVMKPYYLTLLNPSETDGLQLAVGNLFPGEVKQVVFCVSNRNNEENSGMDMGVTSFNYSIELIHTENLALEYRIYELQEVEGVDSGNVPEGVIAALDTVVTDGNPTETVTYWQKTSATPLAGSDVSQTRHEQVELTQPKPVNAGKYISFEKDSSGSNLYLEAGVDAEGNNTFDSQCFLMEIDWQEGAAAEFEKYRKETDMIYLLVEALQPQPEKKNQ